MGLECKGCSFSLLLYYCMGVKKKEVGEESYNFLSGVLGL